MAKALSLEGKKYGRLTAIAPTHARNRDREIIWEWRCDCGNIVWISGSVVKRGRIKICSRLCKQKDGGKQS